MGNVPVNYLSTYSVLPRGQTPCQVWKLHTGGQHSCHPQGAHSLMEQTDLLRDLNINVLGACCCSCLGHCAVTFWMFLVPVAILKYLKCLTLTDFGLNIIEKSSVAFRWGYQVHRKHFLQQRKGAQSEPETVLCTEDSVMI